MIVERKRCVLVGRPHGVHGGLGAAVAPAEPEWHAFWTPFRTEIAARGFISRLERVTGLDYRVLKTDRDRYQVAFSYASDDELDNKLSQISAATGLQLSGQLPR